VQKRVDAPRGLSSGDSVTERQLWIKPFGSWADQNDRDGVTGYDASIHGLVLGADAAVSGQTRAGAAFAYANSHVNTSSALVVHRAKVDSYQAIMYGSHRLDLQTEVNFQADVGSNKTGGSRLINFGGISRTAASAYRSWSAHLGAGISRRLAVGATTNFTPSLRADYTAVRDRGYTETGADALNLKVNRKSAEELTLLGGGKLNHALSEATRLTANLGIGYDALAHRSLIASSFAGGGAAFTTEGIRPSPWLTRGGLALLVNQVNGVEVTAGYDLEVRKGFTNQTASVKFRLPF
jgi:outer membrane autotransporter protein